MITLDTYGDTGFKITWPYHPDATIRYSIINKAKTTAGFAYKPNLGGWIALGPEVLLDMDRTDLWQYVTTITPLARERVKEFRDNLEAILRVKHAALTTEQYSYQTIGTQSLAVQRRGILADAMGLGKSKQALDACNLIGAKRILVVAPKSLTYNWKDEITKWYPEWLGHVMSDSAVLRKEAWNMPGGRIPYIVIANYEKLRLADWNYKVEWDVVILDECLPAGTKIATKNGEKNIEDIHAGDYVLGYNDGKLVETRVVNTFVHESTSPFVSVDGVSITPEHPVWCDGEYLPASVVASLGGNIIKLVHGNGKTSMRMVQIGVSRHPRTTSEILFSKLCDEEYAFQPRSKNCNEQANEIACESPRCEEENLRESTFQRESISQSHSERESSPSSQNQHGKDGTRREGEANTCPAKTSSRTSGVGNGNFYRNGEERPRQREELFTGHSKSGLEVERRSRRRITQGPKETGQSARRISSVNGLDSRQGHEQTGGGRSRSGSQNGAGSRPVYNLETESHNYFANDLLVHNCQKVKNANTAVHKAVKKLKSNALWALSGTPMEIRVEELYGIMSILRPAVFGSWLRFRDQHVVTDAWGNVIGQRNIELLKERIGPWMTRRRKDEVLKQLPPKLYNDVFVDMSTAEEAEYRRIKNQFLAWLKDHDKSANEMNALTQLLRLQQFTCSPALLEKESLDRGSKFAMLQELVSEWDGQVVVFTQFSTMANYLVQWLGANPSALIAGEVPAEARVQRVTAFNAGQLGKVLVSTDAGAYGLNITSADLIVHFSQLWNPGKMHQREDRLHRIGQTKVVNVVNLLVKNTIDEGMQRILDERRKLFRDTIDAAEEVVFRKWFSGGKLRDLVEGK